MWTAIGGTALSINTTHEEKATSPAEFPQKLSLSTLVEFKRVFMSEQPQAYDSNITQALPPTH